MITVNTHVKDEGTSGKVFFRIQGLCNQGRETLENKKSIEILEFF